MKEADFATRKKLQNFERHDRWHCRYIHNFLSHLHFFKVGEIMLSKYEHLMLSGAFPVKVTPFIDTIGEAVVQCDVPVVKKLL